MLAYFAPHTLVESPTLILVAFGLAFWAETWLQEQVTWQAHAMNLCFGVAMVFKYTLAIFAVVPLLEWGVRLRRQPRHVIKSFTFGLALPLLAMGLLDAATWGRPFQSFIAHFNYNFVERGYLEHGVMPFDEYLRIMVERLGPMAIPFMVLLIVCCVRCWRLALSCALALLVISVIEHKEERFMAPLWLWLAPLATLGIDAALQKLNSPLRRSRLNGFAVAALVILALSISQYAGLKEANWNRWRGMFLAQDYVGHRADATGLLHHGDYYGNGGFAILDRFIPCLELDPARIVSPLYNYAVAPMDTQYVAQMRLAGFKPVVRFDLIWVWHRGPEYMLRQMATDGLAAPDFPARLPKP